MGRHIVFKCPRTGFNVQHWLADEPSDPVGATHVSIVCQACTNLHFINRSTGKLPRHENPQLRIFLLYTLSRVALKYTDSRIFILYTQLRIFTLYTHLRILRVEV
jgi:hypothetical protein